jgi:hypothetical protein
MNRPYGLYLLGACAGLCGLYDLVVLAQDRGEETVSVQFLLAARKQPLLAGAAGGLLVHLCGGAVRAHRVAQRRRRG